MRILALVLLLASVPVSLAQSTVEAIRVRLTNKPLYLRGFWGSKDLHFNADGKLIGDSKPISFTLSGFELKKVDLEQGKLVIKGQRVGLDLSNNQRKLVPLDMPLRIDVDTPSTGDYNQALDAIFATSLAELVPTLPSYWQNYAVKHFLPPTKGEPPSQPQKEETQPFKIDSSIKPPRLIHSVAPKVPEWARGARSTGDSVIHLWVMADGTPSHLSIAQPVGIGLDEDAMAAVMKYRFAPATKDGKPVTVELNIQFNFDFF